MSFNLYLKYKSDDENVDINLIEVPQHETFLILGYEPYKDNNNTLYRLKYQRSNDEIFEEYLSYIKKIALEYNWGEDIPTREKDKILKARKQYGTESEEWFYL